MQDLSQILMEDDEGLPEKVEVEIKPDQMGAFAESVIKERSRLDQSVQDDQNTLDFA